MAVQPLADLPTVPSSPNPPVPQQSQARQPWVWAGLVVPVAVGLWLTAPAWGARLPAGDDVMGHLVRAQYGINHFVLHGRLDGWFGRFMVGHQEFLLYGPGFDWLLAAIRGATLGRLSNPGAMKVVEIASVVSLGPAVAYLARSLGLPRRAALLAAVLAMAVDSPFGVGLTATFGIGLVPEAVAAPLFCLGLGGCWRLVSGRGRGHAALTVAAMSALVLVHPISLMLITVFLGLALAVRFVSGGIAGRDFGRLAMAGLVTVGLTAFWLLPMLVHRSALHGPVATWTTPTLGRRLHDIVAGHILFGAHQVLPGLTLGAVVALALVAAVVAALARRPAPVAAVVLAVGFVLIAHGAKAVAPSNEASLLLANRGLGYAGILAVMVVAFFLDRLTGVLGRRGRRAWIAHALALLAAVALVVLSVGGHRVARQQPVVVPAMGAAAAALHELVAPTARFAVERDYPAEIGRTGITQPNLWLAYTSGRDELNVFNGESSASAAAGYVPDAIHRGDPIDVIDQLTRLGVTHLVTVDPATADRYAASGRAVVVWRQDPLAILALRGVPGQPAPASLVSVPAADAPASAIAERASVEHPRWQLILPRPGPVTVALGWSPKWRAHVDGRAVPVGVDPLDRLVSVVVPAGSHRLALDYGPDAWDRLSWAISLGTLAALGAWALRHGLRRSPTSGGASPSPPRSSWPRP